MSQPTMLLTTEARRIREPQNLNGTWGTIRYLIAKRGLEAQLLRLLRAAHGHESNGLPPGDYEYEVLSEEANAICTEFAGRWHIDLDLLKAQIPGLAKLDTLASMPPERDYIRMARVAAVAIPVSFFLMGAAAGLFSLGFHLMGGR